MNDWPGRRRAERSRQWPVLRATIDRIARLDPFEGVIALGSFADGEPDELSDVDLLAVAARGRFDEAWAARRELADDPLATWESIDDSRRPLRWFKWLTRDLVKVECGVVAPGGRELAEPVVVLLGPHSLADAFPRVDRAKLKERAERLRAEQEGFDHTAMAPGERIDWKLSELKSAVRAARESRR